MLRNPCFEDVIQFYISTKSRFPYNTKSHPKTHSHSFLAAQLHLSSPAISSLCLFLWRYWFLISHTLLRLICCRENTDSVYGSRILWLTVMMLESFSRRWFMLFAHVPGCLSKCSDDGAFLATNWVKLNSTNGRVQFTFVQKY